MSYCADINNAEGRTLMTGCHKPTALATLEDALDVSRDARGYAHHASLGIVIHELCDACKGAGQIHGKRFSVKPCKACKGQGFWPFASARVSNP